MTKLQAQVLEFMQAFQQDASTVERIPSMKTFCLGDNLIREELSELFNAETVIERKDAIGDLLYVVYWMANAHGFDMEPITDEIHRSNMSKAWTDAEVAQHIARFDGSTPELKVIHTLPMSVERRRIVGRFSDSKIIKSPSYSKANL